MRAALVCFHGRAVCPECRHDDASRRLAKAHRVRVTTAFGQIRQRLEEAEYQLGWETPEGDDIALRELGRISEAVTDAFRAIGRRQPT